MNGKVNNKEQLISVRKIAYLDGKSGGKRAIEVDNGCISFSLLLDNGFDIDYLRHKGENVSFLTKNGLCGFCDKFDNVFNGGMLYTCGLDTVGGRELPIHGRYHNIPANLMVLECDGESFKAVAEVEHNGLFLSDLLVKRTVETKYKSGKISIKTEVVNKGYKTAEYALLFHMNLGYPFLDSGVKIVAPIISSVPRTEYAKTKLKDCLIMEEPEAEIEETVFFHKVKKGNVLVINEKIGKSVEFNYDEELLPHFIEWKSMICGDYALGIEPSTTTLDGDFAKKKISAGDTHVYDISIEVKDI